MAVRRSQILKVAIILATVVLVTLLFRVLVLHLLPPRQLVLSQLLVRMRDAFAFLAFTTLIAVGIFSSQQTGQHKDVQSNNTRKKPFLEHHPLSSIFGETENDHGMAEADVDALAPPATGSKQMQSNNSDDTVVDYSIERPPANHEPDFEATRVISLDHALPRIISAKSKSVKRVSFLYPSPSQDEALDDSGKQPREKQKVVSTLSPGDITMQADAFIAKFKEQMRMQRLESFYRRQGRDRK